MWARQLFFPYLREVVEVVSQWCCIKVVRDMSLMVEICHLLIEIYYILRESWLARDMSHYLIFCSLVTNSQIIDCTVTNNATNNYPIIMEEDKGLHGTGTATARANSLAGMSESDVKAMLKKKYDKDNNGVFDEEEVDDMMSDLMTYMSETKMLKRNTQILEDDNSKLLRKVRQC